MAATSYTPNLGLCQWEPADRPKRIDFVNDNSIIDTKLGEHLANKGMHLTTQEKEKFNSPYRVITYAGDGASSKTISLDISYTFAIVFQKYYPPVETDTYGNSVLHMAIVGREFGSNSTIVLKSNSIVVTQDTTASDGVINNFNENEGQYVIILFR